ncbi:MAG: glycosyltransferase family 4 protein [Chloroflexi bacterium]|nr:glycosyltransferase family 4 protein [Chloroflexota bacterium]
MAERFRVLMISKACYVAAYRRKLEELATFPDVDLTLVVPPYWVQNGRRALLEPGHTEGYQMVVRNPALNGHFHLHFYPRLGDLVQDLRPDLVHIDEEPYDLVTFHALRIARRSGARTVFFTWQNLRRRLPPPFTWFLAFALNHTDAAIAGNTAAAAILRDRGYRGPLALIPQFGVDEAVFTPACRSEGREQGPLRIGYAGRLVPEKGLPVLLHAVAGLEDDWQLTLLGAGPERPHLERLAQGLGIAERVTVPASLPSTAMPAFYRSLDVLVLPSLTRPNWKEQFGRVLIEAMACGVPPVGSASGEIPNVIGDAGLTFPEGDALALREQLQRLAHQPDLRARLGERGRQRVLAHYTQRQVAAQTYALYCRVLSAPR